MASQNRQIGIPGIEPAPWGEHLCVFFQTRAELLQLVVPFLQAGLEDNEFCMWITGGPVDEQEAFQALEQVLPNAHEYLANKQLEILPYTQWYFSSGVFDSKIVLDNWMSKARHSQAKGFAGIRITGNPLGLKSEDDWKKFGSYEKAVHEAIRTERVLALCTYPMEICESRSMLDTLAAHSSTLIQQGSKWQRLVLSSRETASTCDDVDVPCLAISDSPYV